MGNGTDANKSVISEVSAYISGSGDAELPSEVVSKAKHHILDTLAAVVSGSALKPGLIAKEYAEAQGGTAEAQVAGERLGVGEALAAGVARRHHHRQHVIASEGVGGDGGHHGRVEPARQAQHHRLKAALADVIPQAQLQGGGELGRLLARRLASPGPSR